MKLYRSLASLSQAEEAARTDLVTHSSDQCAGLQTAASDLLNTVDGTGNAVNTLNVHVNKFCDNMQQVSRSCCYIGIVRE